MFQLVLGSGTVQEITVIEKKKDGSPLSEPIVALSVAVGSFVQRLALPSAMAGELKANGDAYRGSFVIFQGVNSLNWKNEVQTEIKDPSRLKVVSVQQYADLVKRDPGALNLLASLLPQKTEKAGAA